MQIDLVIPDLIPSHDLRETALSGLALTALQTLLSHAQKQVSATDGGVDGWLCRAYGIDKQQDWPVAPITLLAEGGDPGNDYWLRADPVHLRATRDKLMLVDSGAFQINQNEAETYARAFNAHFSAEHFLLYPLRPDRWYLKLDHVPALVTQPLNVATGKHLDPFLPQGVDGLQWHRLYNEIQMLFFSLPVNDAREMRGELTVNSIWLWGGGTLPDFAPANIVKLWADDSTACAIASAAGGASDSLPHHATALAGDMDDARVLAGHLRGAAQYGDILGWREGMQQLEKDWFAPLLTMLKSGKISRLRIITPGAIGTTEWLLTRAMLFKFWRRGNLAGLLQ